MKNALSDKQKRRNDVILLLVLVILAAALFCGLELSKEEGAYVLVVIDGETCAQYPLSEDREVRIDAKNGSYNVLTIRGGEASVSAAGCPDLVCARHRAVKAAGETIVCLPNKLVIRIVGAGEGVDFAV